MPVRVSAPGVTRTFSGIKTPKRKTYDDPDRIKTAQIEPETKHSYE
jgi:hypothetical protein